MEKNELVLATRNKHKVAEITDILKNFNIKILALDGIKGAPEVEEDGKTLKQNASKKAREIAVYLKKWTLADDTGLEVAYLGGEPGVYSARWAGPGCTYSDNKRFASIFFSGTEVFSISLGLTLVAHAQEILIRSA